MGYISIKDAAKKFMVSNRKVQKLCELGRINGAKMISGVWLIPENASKPVDEMISLFSNADSYVSLDQLCESLSISVATGKNWVKLGKLVPDYIEGTKPFFTTEYVDKLKQDIQSGKNMALKSRRNKKFVSGNSLYQSYVSDNCKGIDSLQKILSIAEQNEIELTEEVIQLLIADCALHLWADKNSLGFRGESNLLLRFLQNKISIGEQDVFVKDLIKSLDFAISFCETYTSLFELNYIYEPNEDILGLIYISCNNIGNRKATGSYYTPTKIVKKLISHLEIKSTDKILDPCCGTGNFLIQLPTNVDITQIYGNDIDLISVKIARLNLVLKYPTAPNQEIYEHITESDYLIKPQTSCFNYIIGNPPWGYNYTNEELSVLRETYKSATGKNIESYDIFIEQSLRHLIPGGSLAFVLPEAVLNVKVHMPIRQYIIENNSIVLLDYLGNVFDKVQCPCIILQIARTNNKMSTMGMKVFTGNSSYCIQIDRLLSAEYFSFAMTDDEYKIIQKVTNRKDVSYLLNNADFALGIVTGNNKKYITSVKTDDNEMVLKGSDICKYHINPSSNYIVFKPERFQQVAPVEMYRAKEKLLYRFICNQLVFAYDDKKTLSLNSCNIVIPKIEKLQAKYILAILNSRIAQFIFNKKFDSVKILRAHIESIPIPNASEKQQNEIIKIVDIFIKGFSDIIKMEQLYDELDGIIARLFDLNSEEIKIIKDSVDGGNKFLI